MVYYDKSCAFNYRNKQLKIEDLLRDFKLFTFRELKEAIKK